ncbi:epoxide hydrolase family protein [Kutzneria sp. NPDC052558]|uniref:epoxide hydrolase family protein n=1 Tax=Kutzneria sp. NPDC052558 TaxID=3364121 RepID=UPI0037C7AB1A
MAQITEPEGLPDAWRFSRRAMLRAGGAATLAAAAPAALLLGELPAEASVPPDLVLPPATAAIERLRVQAPEQALRDLKARLARTRWPDAGTVSGWEQGVPLTRAKAVIDYWAKAYDWRRFERRVNALPQHRTLIDGLGVHFLHVRSPHPGALPVILSHGWPGSFIEFLDTIDPLTDPVRHGGSAADAFDVVIPSLPGFGFSDRPTATGWTVDRIAAAWHQLMTRLGYSRYVAQGGDWGSGVTHALAKLAPPGLLGIHTNFPTFLFDPPVSAVPTPEETAALAQITAFTTDGAGYLREMTTRPQTVGYGLADSPSGLAAWIYEKFAAWTDGDHAPAFGIDAALDDITLYWLTDTAASSARIYWQNPVTKRPSLDLPVGVSVFPREIMRAPRVWAERCYRNLIHFNDQIPHGGHFAAWEVPEIFVRELRDTFRPLR